VQYLLRQSESVDNIKDMAIRKNMNTYLAR
jgi:hypothetical protein